MKTNKKVFYCERDFNKNLQVLIIVACDIKEANRLLYKQFVDENYNGPMPELKELNTIQDAIVTFEPPGYRYTVY